MCDQWMRLIELPLNIDQFHQLPRNAAYKYEYLQGKAYLSPRPRHYHALLDLKMPEQVEEKNIAPLRPDHWERLENLFAAAFRSVQPFASIDDDTWREAAHQSLERTRTGGDGPLIESACFVATEHDKLQGAIIITLLPKGDPSDMDSYEWIDPPPADCVKQRLGQPHLTWVFVSPLHRDRGTGAALLAAATRSLLASGYTELLSTFLLGNDLSVLWHWRNGFRLLPYPGSMRLMRQRWQQRSDLKHRDTESIE
jgi:GNAT superfamily N-acetyltransferase